MNIKNLIKNKRIRYFLLRLMKRVPDDIMVKMQYRINLGRWPNLKAPKRFTEWIQLYKIIYRNPLILNVVDKFKVREYVSNKLNNKQILNELYQVCDSPDEINYDKLPDKFVIKTTNGGNGDNIIIVADKDSLDKNETGIKLHKWLKKDYSYISREWAYAQSSSAPKIIIEKFLGDDKGLVDYKFLCFNGTPQIIICDSDRFVGHKRNFYDLNWNQINVESDCPTAVSKHEKPANLSEMIEIAKKLSEDFPFVRVDLYNVEGKIYFGELTFYPWSGYVQFKPDSFDLTLGDHFMKVKELLNV